VEQTAAAEMRPNLTPGDRPPTQLHHFCLEVSFDGSSVVCLAFHNMSSRVHETDIHYGYTPLTNVKLFSCILYVSYMQNSRLFGLRIRVALRRSTLHASPSPQANYTDLLTAICRPIVMPTFANRWVSRSQRSGRYFFFRGLVDPASDPLLLRKSASAGNRTRDLWICSHEL
jgi:hypothetical protein